jgi:hypothetical protein
MRMSRARVSGLKSRRYLPGNARGNRWVSLTIRSIRSFFAGHHGLKHVLKRVAQSGNAGGSEPNPSNYLRSGLGIAVHDDAGKGKASDTVIETAFGIQIRADWLNIAGICDLKNVIPEFYGSDISHSISPNLQLSQLDFPEISRNTLRSHDRKMARERHVGSF